MASTPPASPPGALQRLSSAALQMQRSSSRMSISSKQGGGSRASDEDGKTAVKVAVRVRPPLKSTDPGFELIPQRFQRSMLHVVSPTGLAVDSPPGRKLFVFDRVFGADVPQEAVWDYVSESVNAFVQGYNVSVLAYGQSGSGKSYTMGTSGPAEQGDPQVMGVIPRAAAVLFEKLAGPPILRRNASSSLRTPTRYSTSFAQSPQALARAMEDRNWQMKATYLEIYNEQLRDLLVPDSVPPSERTIVAIREDVKGRIILTGLHQVDINSIEDLLKALNFGSSIRQTDATAINAKSSRSHAVFSLSLVQRRNKPQPSSALEKRFSVPLEAMNGSDSLVTVDSKLHFVDLAGSERLKNTGASGERAKEGININAGLASLGKVISQLSSRHAGSHVSYRDSKLTRLLQDSLGGNAITYMIACVTPAEFHLSETLNTVQYAQRARAIQSKPRIQQVSDGSDKQAVIDRLRAEVSFLRDQIRNAENNDRRGNTPPERTERQNEREIELQDHLLDVQENYTALSQRHAKLISEITKARDHEASDTPTLTEAIGDSAVERLKRSNSFAEAVEQVVLEYEKTIQSLETSLSKTRSSLSATESSLLEKETKCAYVETVNQQLQNRVQKLMDRESSTGEYLRDLEAKLDGHNFGEEKNSVVITELRKEIARIRESEASCEEYISTLEERLAETDQDMELMQREVDRLEHVVERQRSLGKLDNLLYEFDHVQQNQASYEDRPLSKPLTNGGPKLKPEPSHKREISEPTLQDAMSTATPDSDDEGDHPYPNPEARRPERADDFDQRNGVLSKPKSVELSTGGRPETPVQSPAQSKFVADKLENVTQELFDLRVDHESTVNEYDMLSAKYEQALRTLAEFQDAVDEARHPAAVPTLATPVSTRPTSFLGDARVNELKDGGHLSSSRSLSSELSLAGDSTSPLEPPAVELTPQRTLAGVSASTSSDETLIREIEVLKKTQAEKDHGMVTLNSQYSQLQELHLETLDVVEQLKAEVQKAKLKSPTTPTAPLIRRKGSQTIMTIDRAHRSLASLRNIAAENLEDKPDILRSFELNLNTTMHELHQRSERVQALEAELSTLKKEMEGKMTMISGLARERSSLKSSSPMDMSAVYSMHDQLQQAENQMKAMQESHADREQELENEIESLKIRLENPVQAAKSAMPGFFPETPAISVANDFNGKQLGEPVVSDQSQEVARLQEELVLWQNKHSDAVKSTQASEQKWLSTISEVKASIVSAHHPDSQTLGEPDLKSTNVSDILRELEKERVENTDALSDLHVQIEDHKATIAAHVERINELEMLYGAARQEVEEGTLYKINTRAHLESHRDQISLLERQLEEHKSSVEFHRYGLKSLHDSHAQALEDMRSTMHSEAKASMQSQLRDQADEMDKRFREKEDALLNSIEGANMELKGLIESRHGFESRSRSSNEQLLLLSELIAGVGDKVHRSQEEKALANLRVSELETKILDIKNLHQQNLAELQKVNDEKDKARRLVDELEDQLSTTYDQQRATSSRFSMLQDQALQDANAVKQKLEEEIEILRARTAPPENTYSTSTYVDDLHERSNSLTSNLRTSASIATLPSPPPAIPLPPLPHNIPNLNPPPPMTNGIIPHKDDLATAQFAEDQEARIRAIEKHLFAEKQLTTQLEEALVDLEVESKKYKADMEDWKKKAWSYEDELASLRKERTSTRYSVQAVEEERNARKEAEAARAHLEERMAAISKKKKKSGFNCF